MKAHEFIDNLLLDSGATHELERRNGFAKSICTRDGDLEIIVSFFKNRWVVICSEIGKIGSVIECSMAGSSFLVDVCLGDRENLWLQLIARQLAASSRQKLPILAFLGLKMDKLDDSTIKEKIHHIIDVFRKLLGLNMALQESSLDEGR